jgi:hypothetical protein
MSNPVRGSRDGINDAEVSHGIKSGIVKEKPDGIDGDNHPPAEVGQESFGDPPNDEIEYVNGSPVIRTGRIRNIPFPTPLTIRTRRRCL